MVKRYSAKQFINGKIEFKESDEGQFVSYDDYKKIRNELEFAKNGSANGKREGGSESLKSESPEYDGHRTCNKCGFKGAISEWLGGQFCPKCKDGMEMYKDAPYAKESTLVCPDCKERGMKSSVLNEGYSSTLLYCKPFIDKAGAYHTHDRNKKASFYKCSEGHVFTVVRRHSCWCGWSGGDDKTTIHGIKKRKNNGAGFNIIPLDDLPDKGDN